MNQAIFDFDDDDDLQKWPFSHALFRTASKQLLRDFIDYHRRNPELYELMLHFAMQAARAGRTRFSIWAIANRCRWYTTVDTDGVEFKISNDYLAVYSRLLAIQNPDLEDFFQFKKMKPQRSKAHE